MFGGSRLKLPQQRATQANCFVAAAHLGFLFCVTAVGLKMQPAGGDAFIFLGTGKVRRNAEHKTVWETTPGSKATQRGRDLAEY